MSRTAQILDLARVITLPGAVKALFQWKPFSITSFRILHRLALTSPTFGTIIDGGANAGQFARAAAERYPDAHILAIEPLPDVYEILKQNMSESSNVEVVRTALGEEDGVLRFNMNTFSHASSALPLTDRHRRSFPDAREQNAIDVPVARLDSLLADRTLRPPLLLKLDLQGYELAALRGAKESLDQIDAVLIEVVFEAMYAGQPLFDEVYTFLSEAGFDIVAPLDVLTDSRDCIVQMDVLFRRRQ